MKKTASFLMISLAIFLLITAFLGCSNDSSDSARITPSPSPTDFVVQEYHINDVLGSPLPTAEDGEGTLVVVISDIHLGDQRSIDKGYGWFIKNEELLTDFLNQVAARPAVKELVIAGDFFDEWVIPMEDETLNGFSPDPEGQSKFVDSIAKAHPGVITGINNVIAAGKKVTYVPGNHDMLVTEADFTRIFPGIRQSRDASGLGTYSPDGLSEAVIEHGHRYDFFNAPDMLSNRIPASSENYTDNADAMLPPGFFVSKIAATHGFQYPAIEGTNETDQTKSGPYLYFVAWKLVLAKIKPTEDPSAKIIKTGIDGYRDTYAINDLTPKLSGLNVKEPLLYKKIEDNWKERQTKNLVNVPISVASALLTGSVNEWCDLQSYTQYFFHDSKWRIVVFGHTHKATIGYRFNTKLQKCIYANSGTWIDNGDPSRTFIVIQQNSDDSGKVRDTVSLYQFMENQTVKKLNEDSLTR